MTDAEIVVQLPEWAWIKGISEDYPDATFRVLSVVSDEEIGVGTLEVDADGVIGVVESIEGSANLESSELLYENEDQGEAIVQFETRSPVVHLAATESKVPVDMPLEISDGEVTLSMTAPHSRISDFVDRLEEYGLEFDVNYIKEIESDSLLTEKQRELVETAIEKGYYDTPRECSLTKLADETDMAKSTCSDMLHRAESKIVRGFMENED